MKAHIPMISFFKHRGFQTLLLIAVYFAIAPFLKFGLPQGLYTISHALKEVLLWIVPVMMTVFIAFTLRSFDKAAPLFLGVLVVFEMMSNLSSVWFAYATATLTTSWIQIPALETTPMALKPLFTLPFKRPEWWSANRGFLMGITLGFVSMIPQFHALGAILDKGKTGLERFIVGYFSPLMPLFILGFVAQMHASQVLPHFWGPALPLFMVLTIMTAVYLSLLFFASAQGSAVQAWKHFKNMAPAGGIAFTSGCSLSTMPWTISGVGKNMDDPHLAKSIIPATTNIQQVGDCLINAFLCCLLVKAFHGNLPPLTQWISFSMAFVLARFATAAVMGGAIFVMLPLYEAHLGFSEAMLSLILTFNVLLDPLVTSTNVMANGALCRCFEQVWQRVRTPKQSLQRS